MTEGKRSTKYAITVVAKAINNVMANIMSTLKMWPKACNQAAAFLGF